MIGRDRRVRVVRGWKFSRETSVKFVRSWWDSGVLVECLSLLTAFLPYPEVGSRYCVGGVQCGEYCASWNSSQTEDLGRIRMECAVCKFPLNVLQVSTHWIRSVQLYTGLWDSVCKQREFMKLFR